MKQKIFFNQGTAIVLLMLFSVGLASIASDWLRAPTLPEEFARQNLHTIDGKEVTIAELSAKKPLLVYLWTNGCSACRYTTAGMLTLSDSDYNVLAVALRSGNDIHVVRLLRGKHLVLPVVNDPVGELFSGWNINASPTYLIVSRGKMVQSTSGWTSTLSIRIRLWWVNKWYS